MYMPGFLIPSDLERMIPADTNPFRWAELNLLASPGAVVAKDGVTFRIPTLVMAVKPDGSCIHYAKRQCQIWETSPFGCAFFDCTEKPEHNLLSRKGLQAVLKAGNESDSLYRRLWAHLWDSELRAEPPEVKRERMNA
jgi:hypothetical protein